MKSRTRPSFWRAYANLDEVTRQAARRAYALFANDPRHPSLRFKKLGGYENIWSVRVNEQYRSVNGGATRSFGSGSARITSSTNCSDDLACAQTNAGTRIEEPAGQVVLEGNEIEAKTKVEDRRKAKP